MMNSKLLGRSVVALSALSALLIVAIVVFVMARSSSAGKTRSAGSS